MGYCFAKNEIYATQRFLQNAYTTGMLKILSWRRRPPLIPTLPFSNISRFLAHSAPTEEKGEIYDPPFCPARPETPQKKRQHKPIIKKKTKQPKDTNKDEKLPVKSELPFDFMYSYSEISPGIEPIGFREPPKFSPFGPGRLDRKWTGTTALAEQKLDLEKLTDERQRVLGDPISDGEIAELVEKYRHSNCSRQINLGKKRNLRSFFYNIFV